MSSPSEKRRAARWQRFFQFSLRDLMLVVLIAAVVLGLLPVIPDKETARSFLSNLPYRKLPQLVLAKYSHARLQEAQDGGKFVVVFLRADWDLASVLNQRTLGSLALNRFVRSRQVALLEFDAMEARDSELPKGLVIVTGSFVLVYAPDQIDQPQLLYAPTADELAAALSGADWRPPTVDYSWVKFAIGPYTFFLLMGLVELMVLIGLARYLSRHSVRA